MAPSVGIIIYQFRIKIHRPVWWWVGWGVGMGMKEFEGIAAEETHVSKSARRGAPADPSLRSG
jgi:hypothetical protein